MWQGLFLALSMFVCSEMSSLLQSHYYYLMYRVGTRVQTCLTAAVYKKVSFLIIEVALELDDAPVEQREEGKDSGRDSQPHGHRHRPIPADLPPDYAVLECTSSGDCPPFFPSIGSRLG